MKRPPGKLISELAEQREPPRRALKLAAIAKPNHMVYLPPAPCRKAHHDIGRTMADYRIVAARPKNASNHINSQFKLYEFGVAKDSWTNIGWKTISQVSDLMRAGNDVRTGKIVDKRMQSGAAVELELRIARNDTKFKLSEMPDA